ncbi:hypothetical protein IFM89_010171 [Coptis chinensis]|uniref:Transposase n=1 Tax=Coptis chinensis TaxID=261450 RepID=A0A835IBF8_9MAGN|nr:hypothetical protein IFM89_010171 [Coptis chinensis]
MTSIMDIEFDSHGQLVGENSGKLASKSGDLVRTHTPITFKDWRKAKELGLKEPFRKYKGKLRKKYFDTCDTNEVRLNNVPDGIRREDWADFVAYEATATTMNIWETNAKNRQELDVYHTSGRHGSARVAHMMNKNRKASAKPVTRVDVWSETHTCKDGSTLKIVAPIMGQVKRLNSAQTEEDSQDILQDPLTKVLGPDKGGRTRGVGSTVSRTQVLALIPAQEKLAELEKERNVKDQTIKVLKSDVEYLKSTVADIKAMHNIFIDMYGFFHSIVMDPERNGESQDNRSNVDQPHIQKKRKASRGTTVMLEMTKNWDGKVITVEYDKKGRPTPRAVRRKIAGYEGALARVMVPLNAFSDWRKLKDFWGGQLEKDLWATMQEKPFYHDKMLYCRPLAFIIATSDEADLGQTGHSLVITLS